eukprot:Nk52_evm1s2422 gene=Nk52_evmTU1s2422
MDKLEKIKIIQEKTARLNDIKSRIFSNRQAIKDAGADIHELEEEREAVTRECGFHETQRKEIEEDVRRIDQLIALGQRQQRHILKQSLEKIIGKYAKCMKNLHELKEKRSHVGLTEEGELKKSAVGEADGVSDGGEKAKKKRKIKGGNVELWDLIQLQRVEEVKDLFVKPGGETSSSVADQKAKEFGDEAAVKKKEEEEEEKRKKEERGREEKEREMEREKQLEIERERERKRVEEEQRASEELANRIQKEEEFLLGRGGSKGKGDGNENTDALGGGGGGTSQLLRRSSRRRKPPPPVFSPSSVSHPTGGGNNSKGGGGGESTGGKGSGGGGSSRKRSAPQKQQQQQGDGGSAVGNGHGEGLKRPEYFEKMEDLGIVMKIMDRLEAQQ